MVLEEEEEDAQPITRKSEIRILDTRGTETRTVSYSDLDREEKENVLTDLLVKSAINHALEKQKRVRSDFREYFSQVFEYLCLRNLDRHVSIIIQNLQGNTFIRVGGK